MSATDEAMAEAERVVRARALALAETIAPAQLALGVGATLRPDVLEPASARVHASLPSVALDAPGQALAEGADLELVSELGRGGMGVVWQARQRSLGRDVAIKRVTSLESVHAVEALLGEARTMGRLEHPSIVPVHALGASAEGPLLVMKRIEGTSLEALLRDASHPAWPALERRHGERLLAYVEILSRVCDALELAHARGIVHCDLKPENVMIGSFGETYLLDWGVARSFRGPDVEIGIAGTPSYMAPEMLSGRSGALGPHTDVYLLGGTLHAMLTGRPLHEGESFQEVLTKASLSEPRSYPPTISADLVSLVHDATRREPSARVPDAATFRARLGEVRAHRASIALTDDVRARLDRFASSLDVAADRRAFLLGDEASTVLAAARFGATHALASWSDNAAARRELDRALGWLAELELARESPEAAAALARERTSEDPALAARIEEARARASKQKSLAARAAAEAVDQDPSVRGGTRALALVVLALVSVAVNFLVIGGDGSDARGDPHGHRHRCAPARSRRSRGAGVPQAAPREPLGATCRRAPLRGRRGARGRGRGHLAPWRLGARRDDRPRRGARLRVRGRRGVGDLAPVDPRGVRRPRDDPRLRVARARAGAHVRDDDARCARGRVGVRASLALA